MWICRIKILLRSGPVVSNHRMHPVMGASNGFGGFDSKARPRSKVGCRLQVCGCTAGIKCPQCDLAVELRHAHLSNPPIPSRHRALVTGSLSPTMPSMGAGHIFQPILLLRPPLGSRPFREEQHPGNSNSRALAAEAQPHDDGGSSRLFLSPSQGWGRASTGLGLCLALVT